MPRVSSTRVKALHSVLGDVALAHTDVSTARDLRRYAFRRGLAHLLAAGRGAEAADLVVDFEYELARRRSEGADADGIDVDLWVRELAAVARRVPRRDTRAWANFARTTRHHYRREGWEGWRVLFQAAMDHADDSPITLGAEAFEASGKRDWAWLRWLNRPKTWQESACLAVMVGHTGPVRGVIRIDGNHVLSWSDDGTVRDWDTRTGEQTQVFSDADGYDVRIRRVADDQLVWMSRNKFVMFRPERASRWIPFMGHQGRVGDVRVLEDGRVLSWSIEEYSGVRDGTLRLWNGQTGESLTNLPSQEQIEGDRHGVPSMISSRNATDGKQGGARTATTARSGAASAWPLDWRSGARVGLRAGIRGALDEDVQRGRRRRAGPDSERGRHEPHDRPGPGEAGCAAAARRAHEWLLNERLDAAAHARRHRARIQDSILDLQRAQHRARARIQPAEGGSAGA
jgi:hypothetical protein